MAGVTASADLVESGAISGKMLKDLYDLCFERNQDFPAVYEAEGRPEQSRDTSALEKLADELIAANPKQVEQYRAGKKTMIGFFVGQVMKASKGQANPQLVNEVLTKKLEARRRSACVLPETSASAVRRAPRLLLLCRSRRFFKHFVGDSSS